MYTGRIFKVQNRELCWLPKGFGIGSDFGELPYVKQQHISF